MSIEPVIKLLVIGDSAVGKSCLLLRFCDDEFTPSFITTVGIDFKIRTIVIDKKKVKLQIWDTAGQERFKTITHAYYRGAMGIMIVYDVTTESSFHSLHSWLKNVEEYAPDVNVTKILVGTKIDLINNRQISKEQGKAFALEIGMSFIEVSSKENVNVDAVFVILASKVMTRMFNGDNNNNNNNTIQLHDSSDDDGDDNDNKNCCK